MSATPTSAFGPGDDSYATLESLQSVEDWSIPTEHPLLWDKEDSIRFETCVAMFASEYLFDFKADKALQRCGVFDPKEAKKLAKQYMANPLVMRHIRSSTTNFRERLQLTEDLALSFIYRDASDFSPFANPLARVNAQKTLARCMNMEQGDGKNGTGGVNVNNNGGVMVVDRMGSVDDWEKTASQSQGDLVKTSLESIDVDRA